MKKIIILEKQPGNFVSYKYVLWVDVPSTRQSFYANSSKNSVYKSISSSELVLLQAGSVAEIVDSVTVNSGVTLTNIEDFLVNQFNSAQASVNSDNPWVRYGSFWDGSGWTLGGVA